MRTYIFLSMLVCSSAFASDTGTSLPTHITMIAPRAHDATLRRIGESVYTEAFKRLGIKVSFEGCVPKRCGHYVTDGQADGEMARALVYEKIYPELVRTNESVFSVTESAFSTNPDIKLNSLDDLKDRNYKIAYMRGYYTLDMRLKQTMNQSNLIAVDYWGVGLTKLLNKEADIYIGVESTVSDEIKKSGYKIYNVGNLETIELYPYFNKKHKLLSEQLALKLREMKADGTMARLLSNYK